MSLLNPPSNPIILPTIILIPILPTLPPHPPTLILPPLPPIIFINIRYHPIPPLPIPYPSSLPPFPPNFLIPIQHPLLYPFTQPPTNILSHTVNINLPINSYFIPPTLIFLLPLIYFTTTNLLIPPLPQY
ncbi:AbgT family transporter, partial [Staphylococcus haemolyticus]|uniref:AbgT family transporter n=1 Tax=Staphylococcus haemolyticus TaxID=1283 RepID=UPI00374FB318